MGDSCGKDLSRRSGHKPWCITGTAFKRDCKADSSSAAQLRYTLTMLNAGLEVVSKCVSILCVAIMLF